MAFQTEFEFQLPKGYVDSDRNVHRQGTMRLATAGDEILPLKDPRVQANPSYLTILVLARVVTALGDLPEVNAKVIEGLFVEDLASLQRLYTEINQVEDGEAGQATSGNGLGVAGPSLQGRATP